MKPQLPKLSHLRLAAFLVLNIRGSSAVARAGPTAPAPNACTNPSAPCNHAGPHYDQPGTCETMKCTGVNNCNMGFVFPGCDGGTYTFDCAFCVLAVDAGSPDAETEAAGGCGSTSVSVAASGSTSAARSTTASITVGPTSTLAA